MRTFVVAFLNMGYGELTMHQVEAATPFEACMQVLGHPNVSNLDEMTDYIADTDSYINWTEIN